MQQLGVGYRSDYGGIRWKIRLDDLEGLIQPCQFCDSVVNLYLWPTKKKN